MPSVGRYNKRSYVIIISVGIFLGILSRYFLLQNPACNNEITQTLTSREDVWLHSEKPSNPFVTEIRMPIESEEVLRSKMTSLRWRCNCPEPPSWLKPVNKRRIEEGKKWQRWKDKTREPLAICKAMSPLYYIGSGITVEPYQTVPIVGLSLHPVAETICKNIDEDIVLSVSSTRRLGTPLLSNEILRSEERILKTVKDNGFTILLNVKKNVDLLKTVLANVQYSSNRYEHDARDKLQISIFNYTIHVYIRVRREPLPDLYDPGEHNSIAEKVTVITKTFERPGAIELLIKTVHFHYPNVTIIIADDSVAPKPIKKPNVKHYIMPFREGCFPGRNLALSQVRTKYVLFLDDDYIFTNETKLQNMIDKLEDEDVGIDIVAGVVHGLPILKGLRYIAYNDTQGYCNLGSMGPRQVSGYPQCQWGEMFINFFMAKTVVLRKIGFYPHIAQAAHEEFWIDTIGKAKSAFCSDCAVTHQRQNDKLYDKYRKETRSVLPNDPLALFENNACYWWVLYDFPNVTDRSKIRV